MILSWLTSSFSRPLRLRRGKRRLGERRFRRKFERDALSGHVELLESRTLLIAWDGGAGTANWNDAANWVGDVLPGSSDNVQIDAAFSSTTIVSTADVTVTGITTAAPLKITSGTITAQAITVSKGLALDGGTIKGAIIQAGTGTAAVTATAAGGTLDGVFLTGDLDLSQVDGAKLTVLQFLNQTGTMSIGNASGTNAATVTFGNNSGLPTFLDGASVVFGGSTSNRLFNANNVAGVGGILRIGETVSIGGKSGTIDNLASLGTIDFYGKIEAKVSGGSLTLGQTGTILHHGIVSVTAGGALTLGGAWTNSSNFPITLDSNANSTLNLGGTFDGPSISGAKLNRTGGIVNVTGTMTGNLDIANPLSSWNLKGGTLSGGTLRFVPQGLSVTASTPALVMTTDGGALDGMTIHGNLNLTRVDGANVTIKNGLALEGTLAIGNSTGTNAGIVYFGDGTGGAQMLSVVPAFPGSGVFVPTVIFGASANNRIYNRNNASGADGTLTFGSTVLIGGGTGTIDNTAATGTIVCQGTIQAPPPGTIPGQLPGTITVGGTGAFRVLKNLVAAGNPIVAGASLILDGNGAIQGGPITVNKSLTGTTTNSFGFAGLGMTQLTMSGVATSSSAPANFEAMGSDQGPVLPTGGNFMYFMLTIGSNAYVRLIDASDNTAGAGSEAVYVDQLIVGSGATLDLNGLHLYANSVQIAPTATIIGGSVEHIRLTATMATVTSPRSTAVDSVEFTFSKAFTKSTLTIDDLALQRNGGDNLLTSAQTISLVSGRTYRIDNLSGLTTPDGSYVLTLNVAGVSEGGFAGLGSPSASWQMDAAPLTVTSVRSVSSPQTQGLASIDFTFSEAIAEATLGIADLSLTRNGGANLLTASQSITHVGGDTYRVSDLTNLTAADGSYVLTVNATGVTDAGSNAGVGSGSTSWTALTTPPVTVESLGSIASPLHFALPSLTVTFSRPIDGSTLSAADFTLTRDGGPNLLTGNQTVSFVGGNTWTLDKLVPLTFLDGVYVLTANAAGVNDQDGHAGIGSLSTTWTMDGIPFITFVTPVLPNPHETAVDFIDVTFTEPIAAASFGPEDLIFRRGNTTIPLAGKVTISPTSGTTWRIGNLGGLTNVDGAYSLTISEFGVQDLSGQSGIGFETRSWTLKRVAPTVTLISPVSPNPTSAAVDGLDVTFSEPIDPATFGADDLNLTLDKVAVTLGGSVIVTPGSGNTWHIGGLAPLTGVGGKYVLTVNTSGLTDVSGIHGVKASSVAWTADFVAPSVKSITRITPNPRSAPVDTLTVAFTEKIQADSFDGSDLVLTRDGQAIDLSGVQITPLSPSSYQISGLAGLTAADGAYVLTIDSTGIADLAGNHGVGSKAATWTTDTLTPASSVQAFPSPTATSTKLSLSIEGTDPTAPNGAVPSGIKTYDLYVSIDGGNFDFWKTINASKTSSITKASYAAGIDHTYAFRSIARDAAGNVESKPADASDASVTVPDLAPPRTQVSDVDASTSTFVVSMEGADVGSSGVVVSFDLYVSIDGGGARRVATIVGTPDGTGKYVAEAHYAAKTDGLQHSYRFFTRGTDGGGRPEAAPAAPDDVVVTATFGVAHLLAPLSIGSPFGLDALFSDPGNVAGLIGD